MERDDELKLKFKEAEQAAEVQTSKSWRGVSVQYSKLRLPAEYEFEWDGRAHYIAHHDLVLLDGEMEVLGEKPRTGGDLRDLMTYVPLGHTIKGWAQPADRMNAFTVVCFDPTMMEEELQAEFNGRELDPKIYFHDDELAGTMRKLGRLMADGTRPSAKIYAETVGLTAALEMFRLGTFDALKLTPSGGLTRAQATLITEYIDENLSHDIGLEDLASVVSLSRFHFARAFKATFGDPPYRYLNHKRVERAKRMLAETRLTIEEVSVACGFNGASQFGRSFRDFVGKSPLAFRRQS
ncbi:AraC family transcriptional regulator [Shinella sp.]|uniref:AraC family transcriptional regulator n=1 Tax=Shinella sp. TaxID=1870904 RepID=UPI0029A38D06|nr:AraC family transcriptional regulator [Shinella sp.]MDX3972504.1 AraC family transcriptional regulator [Shinella sp.]